MNKHKKFRKVEIKAFLASVGITLEEWKEVEKTREDCPGYMSRDLVTIEVIPRDALDWMVKNQVRFDQDKAQDLYGYPTLKEAK